MANTKMTSMRMTDQTRNKINALLKAGHSSTITGIIEMAIDRMYRDELVRGNVQPVEDKPRGWVTT
jgi:predicted DNA-binding protein